MVTQQVKVTITLPTDLKDEVVKLKDELKISLNSIYKAAIAEYLEQQEIKKWKKGYELASNDKNYIELCEELGSDNGELYEYETKWGLVG